jgi:hypothetical protein
LRRVTGRTICREEGMGAIGANGGSLASVRPVE